MPKISVVIPAYNAAGFIDKCLESLIRQTFLDFEIIVADDASTDETASIAARYAKVTRSEKNEGVGAARNRGADASSGEILAFTDADVILPENWLANILRDIESFRVRCVGGGYSGSEGNSFIERFAHLELAHRRKNTPAFVKTLVANNFACTRDVFYECGKFPERYVCEDLRLSFKISQKYEIYWDKDNGVLHHFKNSLRGYLKQQFRFARDTVWSYYCHPGMIFSKTHQGQGIYLETVLTMITLAALWKHPLLSLAGMAAIVILNRSFLLFLRQNRLPLAKSTGVILVRDIVCVMGIFSGIWNCLFHLFRSISGRNPFPKE
ncbi:MAG TPA: glycosyltransferase [Candidatus Omnitrophota bacterium]|nr:glycosyltransferase [Candidatus Omnitrophota bacterium]